MDLYYGTTSASVRRIRKIGLRPSPPEGRVWVSRSLPVAESRARKLSRSQKGRPMVLVCRLDVGRLRRGKADRSVWRRGPMVALRGGVEPHEVVDVLQVADDRQALAAQKPVVTDGEVFQLLDSPSPRVRLMGVLMLGTQNSAEVFDWLCTRLDDPDPRVRLGVAVALRRWGRDTDQVLHGMRADEDPLVRRAAHEPLDLSPAVMA